MTDDHQIMAAEYAMGLLDGEAELRAERLRRNDKAFDNAVWWWEEHLSGAISQVDPVAPPRNALAGIHDTLFGKEIKTAKGKLRWKPIVGGIVSVKAALLSAYLVSRAVNTESYVVETRYGDATVSWNTRAGTLQLKSQSNTTLHLWKKVGDGFSYLGSAGSKITAGFVAGDIIILSADGPLATAPEPIGQTTLLAE